MEQVPVPCPPIVKFGISEFSHTVKHIQSLVWDRVRYVNTVRHQKNKQKVSHFGNFS